MIIRRVLSDKGPPPSQGGSGGPGGAWWASMKCLNHCGGWPVAWSNSWSVHCVLLLLYSCRECTVSRDAFSGTGICADMRSIDDGIRAKAGSRLCPQPAAREAFIPQQPATSAQSTDVIGFHDSQSKSPLSM